LFIFIQDLTGNDFDIEGQYGMRKNQPISQSANQPISQSANQPISQSANQPIS
jgi:hypothetical protein